MRYDNAQTELNSIILNYENMSKYLIVNYLFHIFLVGFSFFFAVSIDISADSFLSTSSTTVDLFQFRIIDVI